MKRFNEIFFLILGLSQVTKTVTKVTKQSQTSHVSAIRKSGSSEGGAGARCTGSEPGLPSSRGEWISLFL